MRSAIFSIVSGIALTLLMRAPAPKPPTLSQPCPVLTAVVVGPPEAIPARLADALGDSLPAWLAGQRVPSAPAVVAGGEGRVRHTLDISVWVGKPGADTCRNRLAAATAPLH